MIEQNDIQAMATKIKALGIPHIKLNVFGRIRLNVHVICKSRATADRWAQVLGAMEPGRQITCTKTRVERAVFKGDAQSQNTVPGWLVAL